MRDGVNLIKLYEYAFDFIKIYDVILKEKTLGGIFMLMNDSPFHFKAFLGELKIFQEKVNFWDVFILKT